MSEHPCIAVRVRTNAAWPAAFAFSTMLARIGLHRAAVRIAMLGVSFEHARFEPPPRAITLDIVNNSSTYVPPEAP